MRLRKQERPGLPIGKSAVNCCAFWPITAVCLRFSTKALVLIQREVQMSNAKKPVFEPRIVELDYEPRLAVDVAFDPPRPPQAEADPSSESSRSSLATV